MLCLASVDELFAEQQQLIKTLREANCFIAQNHVELSRLGYKLAEVSSDIDQAIRAGSPLPTAWHIVLKPRCATCGEIFTDGRTTGSHTGCQ